MIGKSLLKLNSLGLCGGTSFINNRKSPNLMELIKMNDDDGPPDYFFAQGVQVPF
jgi:hypothetical protein